MGLDSSRLDSKISSMVDNVEMKILTRIENKMKYAKLG